MKFRPNSDEIRMKFGINSDKFEIISERVSLTLEHICKHSRSFFIKLILKIMLLFVFVTNCLTLRPNCEIFCFTICI